MLLFYLEKERERVVSSFFLVRKNKIETREEKGSCNFHVLCNSFINNPISFQLEREKERIGEKNIIKKKRERE